MTADVDIDFFDRNQVLGFIPHTPAMIMKEGKPVRHNSGVYLQDIPVNPLTDLAAFDYKKADELGYFKIDFLNNSIYEGVSSKDHLDALINKEPLWELIEDRDFVSRIAHIGNHFEIVDFIKPRSVEDLAIVLAIIRPGKRYLYNEQRSMDAIRSEVWVHDGEDENYYFKKSHATAYAVSLVAQINLITEQVVSWGDLE